MAPESLRKKIYTHKSDVWSYAVTVWEILTFGARPYGDKNARDIVRLIEGGDRLKQPITCTIELYAILLECKLFDIPVLYHYHHPRPSNTTLFCFV